MRTLIAISEDVVDERAAHAHHTHTHRSMAARDVDAADRILDRRRRAQISRRTGLNECVRPYEYFPGCSASFPAQTDARRCICVSQSGQILSCLARCSTHYTRRAMLG